MTRLEFMKKLESLLVDIPLEEREEALRYYNGYFDDAGADQEDTVITELGSPERIAAMIKADLSPGMGKQEKGGYYTENGYRESIRNRYEISEASEQKTGGTANTYANKKSNSSNAFLIILLLIIASPVWFPIAIAAFSVAIAILAVMSGLLFGMGVAGLALVGSGLILFIAGIAELAVPFVGLMMLGSGLLLVGIGMLLLLITIVICRYVLPPLAEGFVNLCRLPFKRRRVMA